MKVREEKFPGKNISFRFLFFFEFLRIFDLLSPKSFKLFSILAKQMNI